MSSSSPSVGLAKGSVDVTLQQASSKKGMLSKHFTGTDCIRIQICWLCLIFNRVAATAPKYMIPDSNQIKATRVTCSIETCHIAIWKYPFYKFWWTFSFFRFNSQRMRSPVCTSFAVQSNVSKPKTMAVQLATGNWNRRRHSARWMPVFTEAAIHYSCLRITLTHYPLMTPYGDKDIGQQWHR